MYTSKLTCESFVLKDGHIFEISPKIQSDNVPALSMIGIHNLRSVTVDSNAPFSDSNFGG